ncbi:MAG: hypothetical protein AB1813_25000 [Verrucomicrobiota bacterium]
MTSFQFRLTAVFRRIFCLLLFSIALPPLYAAVNYDIVYVRAPRFGDDTNSLWPEVFHPAQLDPGADLVLLHPDGSEEVLVRGGLGSVTDPFISLDGEWCFYVLFPNLQRNQLNSQRADLPYQGADIYKIHLRTRQIVRLTFQEFTPNTGGGHWDESNPVNPPVNFNRLGYGILNLGPCPLPGGKIAFTSNRNGFVPPREYTSPTLQLFVMDEDGENVTFIAPMNIGSALHPTTLQDGRIMFSSYESQGIRDIRLWAVWAIHPDGRNWSPIVSAFRQPQAFHFMTQLGNGDLIIEDYYNLNNNGFGALYRMPVTPPAGQPAFHSAFPHDNPAVAQTIGQGFSYPFKMPFTPRGLFSITPFTHGLDEAAPVGKEGVRVGKFTHPSAAPNNDLLVVWTPGPANDLNRPTTRPYYDAGLYLIRGGNVINDPTELVRIKNDPAFNEAWPRAVVSYQAVHGMTEPRKIPWLPNDGTAHRDLPRGTAYGIVGTSSFYKRESFPGYVTPWSNSYDGLDAFNTTENEQSSNWIVQGSDAGKYANSEIHAVRILVMEGSSHRSYGPNMGQHFFNHANEKLRILGEIPLRKFNPDGSPVRDPEGNPDTSFMARIPADTPFTFQMVNRHGMTLTMAQTWHQVRPGEVRNNCGGCHAHSQAPLDISLTVAGQPDYQPVDLTSMRTWLSKDESGATVIRTNAPGAVNVEFYRDIRPLLQKSCTSCHSRTNDPAPGNLVLDDHALYGNLPGDYARLAADDGARWGHTPLVRVGGNPQWRQSNASRYVRMFQSRRSLLIWKLFGERLDGWSNEQHPTERTPGDPATLPAGANINAADLDYTGEIMPPPNSGVPPLTEDEKMTFVRWIDLGCPINLDEFGPNRDFGWFLDDNRPALMVSSPQANRNAQPLSEIRVGVADAYSGIQPDSLSIKADFTVNGLPAGTELAGRGTWVDGGIYSVPIDPPLAQLDRSNVTVSVRDRQGNRTTSRVRFWIDPGLIQIREIDRALLIQNQLRVRFTDSSPDASHDVLASVRIDAPSEQWMTLRILGAENLPESTRQLDVEIPAGSEKLFLRIKRR